MVGERIPAGEDERTDAVLLTAVADGDRSAFHELFRRHEPWLSARLTYRCPDPAIVDQAIDDTFLSVWRRPRGWRGEGEVAAWLWGIAIRSLLHELRPRRNVVERLSGLRTREPDSPEELVLARLEHSSIGVALESLSPELLAVVQATVLDGLSTREAAALLGIPSGTVKSRMSRARTQLRGALL
ncbi:RNA polymerase sigma factor [Nocardioides insulae]|uniref:RNA polymerase sigma factor n=1 Tax=Nocardioides insulae TaxID=394734 RepID=UPI0004269442|nr:sigma-70 family RNA polymerase sigma factor [Nocardioides insulae]